MDFTQKFSLKGKVALVTGASYGIGFAIATAYAEAGATIVFNDIKQELVDKGIAAYKEKGIEAHGYVCDVTDEDQVNAMVAQVEKEVGVIDILVNNAGISKEYTLLDMPVEVWDEIYQVNLRSVMLLTKAFLPSMVKHQSGNIVNIGSGAALRGLPDSIPYAVSKAGVVCFTQTLGDEIRKYGIRTNVIRPGPIDTEMFKKSAVRDFILAGGGDVFSPETAANAVLYLASSLSEGMNSQTLTLRGFNRW